MPLHQLLTEQLYRALVDNAQGLICVHAVDGTLLYVNDAVGGLLGYTPHEIVGRNLVSFLPSSGVERFEAYLRRLAEHRQVTGVFTLMHRDGHPVHIAYQNFRVDAGETPYVIGHGIDVSDRIHAEAQNRRFAAILEMSPDFVGVADANGRPLYLNRGGRDMCGLVGNVPDSITAIHPARAQATLERALATAIAEGSWSGETWFQHQDGREIPISQVIVAPRDRSGQVEFIATIARDISDRLRIEASLRESEQRLRRVVEQMREVLFETDAGGRWTYLNPAWTEITGFDVASSLGRPFLDFVHPDDVERIRCLFEPLIQRKTDVCRHEVRYVTADGGLRWIEVHARLAVAADGTAAGTSGTLRDVTEQRALADQKSQFLANMSHEIRTPINGVVGLATMLLDTTLTEAQRALVEGIAEAGQALRGVIDDVLDVSKLEAGRLTIAPSRFALRSLVASAVAPIEMTGRAKGLHVDARCEPGVPEWVVGDPGRVRQVLVNLLGNAEKFTRRGSISVAISPVLADDQYAGVRCVVRDTGIGIAADQLPRIFDSFVQADGSPSREYGGSGLGLTISRQLVQLMGGAIGAESTVGEGSMFWFTLPLPAAQAAPAEEADSGAARAAVCAPVCAGVRAGGSAADTARLRVLLAEDNRLNRIVARGFLEKAGCEVVTVGNGQDAVAAVRAGGFAAVFMDCQMPVMDGYEATRRIRRGNGCAHLPIVAMTAHAMSGDRETCLAAGMNDYLPKPLTPDAVAAIVAQIAANAVDVTPVFDPSTIRESFGEAAAALDELVAMLGEDVPNYVAAIDRAAATADWATVQRLAHTLRGAVSTVGAGVVRGVTLELERAAGTGDAAAVNGERARLHSAASALVTAVGQWVDDITQARTTSDIAS